MPSLDCESVLAKLPCNGPGRSQSPVPRRPCLVRLGARFDHVHGIGISLHRLHMSNSRTHPVTPCPVTASAFAPGLQHGGPKMEPSKLSSRPLCLPAWVRGMPCSRAERVAGHNSPTHFFFFFSCLPLPLIRCKNFAPLAGFSESWAKFRTKFVVLGRTHKKC